MPWMCWAGRWKKPHAENEKAAIFAAFLRAVSRRACVLTGALADYDEQHGRNLCIPCNRYKESILSREFCGKTGCLLLERPISCDAILGRRDL